MGSESPQEQDAIISTPMLVGISEWRRSQERQSVLITMKVHTLWSELPLPSLFICLSGETCESCRLVMPGLVSFQGFGYHYRLMNKNSCHFVSLLFFTGWCRELITVNFPSINVNQAEITPIMVFKDYNGDYIGYSGPRGTELCKCYSFLLIQLELEK